jgi:hypothetical protein
MPTFATTISTVPLGRPLVSAWPIAVIFFAASSTEMPGEKRTYIMSIASSISGKNVLGRREAAHPAPATSTTAAPTMNHRTASTSRSKRE